MEVRINVEGGIFWKKIVHKCNMEWRVEKILEINKHGGWKCAWRVEFFFKINKHDSMFIREMRVLPLLPLVFNVLKKIITPLKSDL